MTEIPKLPCESGTMRKPELLAPAGGFEQLEYAILFGADAVYLATDKFSLRRRAGNFSLDEVAQVTRFAHEAGVRVYVTCNAFLHDKDTVELPAYLEALAAAGVDSLIVGDLGVLRLARRYAPQVKIHISTQASCSNTEAALAWYESGARRIVCAREMSLEELTAMRRQLPAELELEVFVHGAMCMAISGRCLMSDYLTGRSANQGHCTQPCRWNYAVLSPQTENLLLEEASRPGRYFPIEEDERGTYIMSSHDLNMLAHLEELRAAGIDSLKIEGRNKKAFYVATVVNAYRRVLDGADSATFVRELEMISHRPYSTGFFFGPATQISDSTSYIQNADWVGDVLSCEAIGQGRVGQKCGQPEESAGKLESPKPSYLVHFACRNRLCEGDVIEVLSPGRQIESVIVTDLTRELPDGELENVEVANVSMDVYRFTSFIPLRSRDILRSVRTHVCP